MLVAASCWELPPPLLLLLFYCYLLITVSFDCLEPSPASAFSGCLYFMDRGSKATWIMDRNLLVGMGTVVQWECGSPGMHIVYIVNLLITTFTQVVWPRGSGTKVSFPLLLSFHY